MKLISSGLADVLIVEPRVFEDARGTFFESFNQRALEEAGITARFVQDNISRSRRNVIRGLHYQVVRPQGKLIRAIRGEVFDVAVDIRPGSPAFGRWAGFRLSEADRRMAWIPPGFAHGFLALTEVAEVLYKVTEYWHPEHERTIRWDDADIGVRWPLEGAPVLSAKDANGAKLSEADLDR